MLPEHSSISLFVTAFFILQLPEIIFVRFQIWYHPMVNEQLLISYFTSLFNHSKLSFLILGFVVVIFALKCGFKSKQVGNMGVHDPQTCKATGRRRCRRPVTYVTQGPSGWIYAPKDRAFTFLRSLSSQEAKGLM